MNSSSLKALNQHFCDVLTTILRQKKLDTLNNNALDYQANGLYQTVRYKTIELSG